jgi:hypothetical protein
MLKDKDQRFKFWMIVFAFWTIVLGLRIAFWWFP